jgi:hypothetical protein
LIGQGGIILKFRGRGQSNSKSTRRLQAIFFALILVGSVFIGIIGSTTIEPPHSDYGEDTDGDSLYNYLIVNVTVNVTTPGDYILNASLEDSLFTFIDSDTNFTFLNAGIQVVQIRFEGWLIRANGKNGPYDVYLDLYDDLWNLMDVDIYTTASYNSNEFELPPAKFILPHSDYGLDTDSDGYFNYLVVNVTVNVSVAGSYEVDGELIDSILNSIDIDANLTFLSVGDQVVQLYFDGLCIYKNGVDGPYTVNLSLYDDSMNWMDSDVYTTNSYLFTQFQPPDGTFEPPHSDYGLDTDSDGKFNYLVVNVTVNVTVAGFYQVDGGLFDGSSNLIDSDSNYTFLNAGIQVVELRFSGIVIYNHGQDGPYTVELDLYNDSSIWMDSDTYFTGPYTYDQFQPPPSVLEPPHSEYGLDTDSDGFFNYFVVNVTVNVSVAGDYRVEGSLIDTFFNLIEFTNNLTFLNTGIQVVQLYFTGWMIYNHGVNGTFFVFLELFDSSSNFLDTNIYITSFYTYDQFQPLIPPQPPTGLHASLVGGGLDVMLSWNASLDDGIGEDDVVGYTVYRSTTGVNGVYEFAAWILADDSSSYNWIDSGAGDGDPNDYFYIVRANDTLDTEEQNTDKVGKVVYDLIQGWNLISIPLEQSNTARQNVLLTLGANYAAVQGYHAGKSTPWLHWHRDKPNQFNDVIDINHKEGYYVYMDSADSLVVAGRVLQTTQISLKEGWNLVGYPSLETKQRDTALASILGSFNKVEFLDAASGVHEAVDSSDPMNPGFGYWIHAKTDCIWEMSI